MNAATSSRAGAVGGHDDRDATSTNQGVGGYLAACDRDVRGLRVGVPEAAYIQASDLVVNGHVLVHAGETNLYQKAAAHFSIRWYVALYVLAMLVLACHLLHGFRSAFQSLGWRHATWTPVIRVVGTFYAIAIPAGFASIPLYFLFMV